ncbi:NADPH-dependent curcumin reductase CurA [Constrictibacter sp. MBR-5]|uniref:NADP-dependent oxidoreductase n=1 Tax=Constrictibacter sp. MBR-5 TaxID=3156467 RepID=UPI00339A9C61
MTPLPKTVREVRLKSRPQGMPQATDFEIAEVPMPVPGDGQMLIRTVHMSVDPYMRGRMSDRKSYAPPFELGKAMDGRFVGEVMESKGGRFEKGAYVAGFGGGWKEYHVADGKGLLQVDPDLAPLPAWIGVLGMPGMTAYVGLLDIGQPKPGETVFVSAASGAVGALVCQIAKIKGCRVVGSAGSDEKCRWLLDEAGVDAAVNYKTCGDLEAAVAQHCPDGIDVYFENVGGEHLVAALNLMNMHGRIAACGMISRYNDADGKPQPGPHNLFLVVGKRLRMQGFIVSDHAERIGDFQRDVGGWIRAGKVKWKETVYDGLDRSPEAFLGLFKGDNFGKMVVRVGPERLG